MDFNQIQEIIRMVSKHKISEFILKEGEFKLIVRNQIMVVEGQSPAPVYASAPVQPVSAAPAAPVAAPAPKADVPPAASTEEAIFITIKSPMVGTF